MSNWINQQAPICDANTKFNLNIEADGDYSANIGTEDYKYTWKVYYFDSEIFPKSINDMEGPYTVPVQMCYKSEAQGYVKYDLQVALAPEGNFTKELTVGKKYDIIIAVFDGDECQGFLHTNFHWKNEDAASRDLYNAFWTRHDRSQGYKTGDQELTNEDIEDARSVGFSLHGNYQGPTDPDLFPHYDTSKKGPVRVSSMLNGWTNEQKGGVLATKLNIGIQNIQGEFVETLYSDRDALWSITFSWEENGINKSKTIKIRSSFSYEPLFIQFSTVEQEEKNQFVPQNGVAYTIELSVLGQDGVFYPGKSEEGAFVCNLDVNVPDGYKYN